MLEDRPMLRDRLTALAVFSGIAVAAVSGFELIIGGGFDFVMPGREIRQMAPSQYVEVVQTAWGEQTRYLPLSSNEPMFAGDAYADARPDARLAGGYDDAAAPDGAYSNAMPSEDELYREIEALYARQDEEAAAAVVEAEYEGETYQFGDDDKAAADTAAVMN